MTSSEYRDMTGAFPVSGQAPSGEYVYGPNPMATSASHFPASPLPPQAPPVDPYAPTGAWSSPYEDFTTPSGQRCLIKKLDLPDLVSAGLLDQMDNLSPLADEAIRRGEGQPPIDVMKAMRNPATIRAILPVLDKVLKMVVVKPELHDAPAPGEPLVPGRAYLHAVSLTDKMAIFNRAAGEMDDLKSLREESA